MHYSPTLIKLIKWHPYMQHYIARMAYMNVHMAHGLDCICVIVKTGPFPGAALALRPDLSIVVYQDNNNFR